MKEQLERRHFDAISNYNALLCTSQSYDRQGVDKKNRIWKNFIDSLDWDKLNKEPTKPDPVALKSIFGSLGVPSTNIQSKEKKDGKK